MVPQTAFRSVRPVARIIRCIAVALFLTLAPLTAAAQSATPTTAASGLDAAAAWLQSQQAADGGFPGFSGTSDASATTDAVLALAAARNAGVAVDLTKAVEFLEQNALVYAQTGPGQAAKLVLTIVAAGGDPTDVKTVNPLSIVEISAKGSSGIIGFGLFDHALGVLALVATGHEVPQSAIDTFRAAQLANGSWAFDGTTADQAGDTNTTAMAIQALAAAGLARDPMIDKALAYLKSSQVESGAFPFQPGSAPNGDANSTAIVVQAILAVGQDPASPEWKNAAAALAAFQNPSGAFRYTDDLPDDNLFATVQAIPALAGQPYPITAAPSTSSDGTDVTSLLAA
jgi:hypothetical protein